MKPYLVAVVLLLLPVGLALDLPGLNSTRNQTASPAATVSELVDLRQQVATLTTQLATLQAQLPVAVSEGVATGMATWNSQYQAQVNSLTLRLLLGSTGGFLLALCTYALVSNRTKVRLQQRQLGGEASGHQ